MLMFIDQAKKNSQQSCKPMLLTDLCIVERILLQLSYGELNILLGVTDKLCLRFFSQDNILVFFIRTCNSIEIFKSVKDSNFTKFCREKDQHLHKYQNSTCGELC